MDIMTAMTVGTETVVYQEDIERIELHSQKIGRAPEQSAVIGSS